MSSRIVTRVVGGLGDLCLTAGAVLLLFCVYQLWWTNLESAQARNSALSELRSSWAEPGSADFGEDVPGPSASPGATARTGAKPATGVPVAPAKGSPFALIRIPRLGKDWAEPIVEGTGADQLHEGIGHYVGTALPGQRGNLALAGHRATNGEPFRDLDRMRPGDQVVVQTRDTDYTYTVDKPWILVSPSATEIIAPVPGRPGRHATERKMTLTTCNPRWASTQRLIVELTLQTAVRRA